MDEVIIVNTTQTNPILIIIVFVFILLLLGLIIWVIIIMVPLHTESLNGACSHQLDCGTGLVCSQNSVNVKTVCLSGLSQPCKNNTECANDFVCLLNNDKVKVCSVKPITTQVNIMTNDLAFDRSSTVTGSSIPIVTGSSIPIVNGSSVANTFINPMVPITKINPNFKNNLQFNQNQSNLYQNQINQNQSNLYNQNRIKLSPLMAQEKQRLTRFF